MKKQFIPFLFLLLSITTTQSPQPGSTISITNLSAQRILIEIDGRRAAENNITISNLTSGYHLIKLFTENPQGMPRQVVLYNKNTYLKPNFYVDIIVNRFGRALIDEQPIGEPIGNNNPPPPVEPQPQRPSRPDRDHDRDRNEPRPMPEDMFMAVKETVRRESFDDSRASIARSIIDQNFFTSAQAKELAQLFVFENNKLAIAKYLYGKTLDRKNYFIVYSVFTFDKSKKELAEYVRTYQ